MLKNNANFFLGMFKRDVMKQRFRRDGIADGKNHFGKRRLHASLSANNVESMRAADAFSKTQKNIEKNSVIFASMFRTAYELSEACARVKNESQQKKICTRRKRAQKIFPENFPNSTVLIISTTAKRLSGTQYSALRSSRSRASNRTLPLKPNPSSRSRRAL